MTNSPQGAKYDFRGAQFAGGMAHNVEGNQEGGIINIYGAKIEDITRLISDLREQVKSFPDEHKSDALDILDGLESDIKQPEQDSDEIMRRLRRFVAVSAAVGSLVGGTAAFSGDLNEIKDNVTELTEICSIPIEQVEPERILSADIH